MYPYTRFRQDPDVVKNYNGVLVYDGQYADYLGNPGTPQHTETAVSASVEHPGRWMFDVPTKRFKEIQKQGGIVNTPCKRFSIQVTNPGLVEYQFTHDFESKLDKSWGRRTWTGHKVVPEIPSIALPFPETSEDLIDRAVSQAYANITASEATALMMAAEGKKTIVGLGDILVRVGKILVACKRLDAKTLSKEFTPKELADRYMELRYALRPLVYDAKSICAAHKATLETMRQTFRGTKFDVDQKSDVYVDASSSYVTRHYHRTAETKIIVRAGVLTDITPNSLSVWGWDQLIETALEVTPLSFVFNWFFNISDIICSWTPQVGIKELASWYTIEQRRSDSRTFGHADVHPGDPNVNLTRGSYYESTHITSEESTVTRVCNPDRAVLPHIAVNLDLLKLIDLTLILKNLLRK